MTRGPHPDGSDLTAGPPVSFGVTAEQAEILGYLSLIELDDGLGSGRPTIRIEGANLQLVNGLGATNGNPADPGSDTFIANGVGNLILGYEEVDGAAEQRTGSHNLVLGYSPAYSAVGGLVSGSLNEITAAYALRSGRSLEPRQCAPSHGQRWRTEHGER